MKKITLAALIFLYPCLSDACTVCGCSASNQYLGVLPQFYKHFVGLQYQHRDFRSEHPGHGEHGNSSFSNEQYSNYQLWGRYNMGNRLRLFAFVPFVSNTSIENGSKTVYEGLGDITILANMRLLGVKQANKLWQHNLQAGGGIKLPTGAYDSKAIQTGEGLPNMQPGTKSWDFIANANYTVRRRSVGMNLDMSYTFTTPGINSYKFGNRLSTGISAFYWWQRNSVTILPQAGLRFDKAAGDYENHAAGKQNDMSGGEQLYVSGGIQVYYKRTGLQFMYYKPVKQYYANGLVINNFRAEAGVYFLF